MSAKSCAVSVTVFFIDCPGCSMTLMLFCDHDTEVFAATIGEYTAPLINKHVSTAKPGIPSAY